MLASLAQLRDAQLDGARARLPQAIAIAVAVVDPRGTALAMPGAVSTSSFSRRRAAKPTISRSRSASELFSNSARRFSSVIVKVPVRVRGLATKPYRRPTMTTAVDTADSCGRCVGLLIHSSYAIPWDATGGLHRNLQPLTACRGIQSKIRFTPPATNQRQYWARRDCRNNLARLCPS